jgi:hypothetical protein
MGLLGVGGVVMRRRVVAEGEGLGAMCIRRKGCFPGEGVVGEEDIRGMCNRRSRCFKGDKAVGLVGLCRIWRDRWEGGGGRLERKGMRGNWMRGGIDLLDGRSIHHLARLKATHLKGMSDLPRRDMIDRHLKVTSVPRLKGMVNHRIMGSTTTSTVINTATSIMTNTGINITTNTMINIMINMDTAGLHLRSTINRVHRDILLRLKDTVNRSTDNLDINNHMVDHSSTDSPHPHTDNSIMENLRIVEVLLIHYEERRY